MNLAVFIDRDGTINIDKGYVYKIEDFEFIPRTIEALKKLSKTNLKIIILTDQSGIGRGYYTIKDFNLDLEESYVIGDKTKDIMLGKNAGCKTLLVKTGKAGSDNEFNTKPDFIAEDLYEAVNLIMNDKKNILYIDKK